VGVVVVVLWCTEWLLSWSFVLQWLSLQYLPVDQCMSANAHASLLADTKARR